MPVSPKLPVTSQTYVPPYHQNHSKHGGLSPSIPFVPSLLPPHLIGDTAAKDIKMELITKWDSKLTTMQAFLINYFNHFII